MGKRTLRDLYIVGKPVTLDDGDGEPVDVFIRKMNDARHAEAMKRAGAAKSRMKAALKDENSPEYLAILESIDEFGREGCITYLLQDFQYTKERVIEAEVGAREEWDDENYLEGLQQAWMDGLNDEYAKDPEHVDAKRTFDELKRFADDCEKEMEGRLEAFKKDLDTKTDEQLEKMVVAKYGEVRTASAWLQEFRRCEIWLSTFEPDKRTLAMEDRSVIDDLEPNVISQLMDAIEEITVEGTEGKESQDSPTS